jgi:hypothetical protein
MDEKFDIRYTDRPITPFGGLTTVNDYSGQSRPVIQDESRPPILDESRPLFQRS